MSSINELNNNIVTSGLTTQNSTNVSANNPTENTNEDFDSVMLQALKNCNGQRPEHVCCCGNSHVEESVEEIDEAEEVESMPAVAELDETDKSEATEEEKLTAGSCFTMFIRISTRITTEVGHVMSGKFRDTTLAFADALKADKSHNENLLTAYMKKTDDMISSQTEELKNYISSYLDNMFSVLKTSVSGLNSTLLGSSNLLGNSLSDYSNLLSNSSLLSSSSLLGSSSNSLASGLLSSLTSSMTNYSNSSSLAGYSAIDAANAQLTALLGGTSNYSYGIGTSLNTNRYAGRNLSIIKSSEVETTGTGGLKMVDTKGNSTTGVASTGVEIGNSSAKTVSTASSASSNSTSSKSSDSSNVVVAADSAVSEENPEVEIKLASNTSDSNLYIEALKRKNHIVDLFKEMILNSIKDQDEDNAIKHIDTKISVSIV